jgi:hypothetical protein
MSNDSISNKPYIDESLLEPMDLTVMGRSELIKLIGDLQKHLKDIKYQLEK